MNAMHNHPHPQPTEPSGFDASRRRAITYLAMLFNAVAGALVAVPILGYALAPLLRVKNIDEWIELGPVDDFPMNETRRAEYDTPKSFNAPWDGATIRTACFVRRLGDADFSVLAVNCTHLGCPVDWFPQSGLYLCPCHGGVYYADGAHASGPPPRGLYQYPTKIENGALMIKGGHLPTLQNTYDKTT
jgi:Rieske Fe-S protein